MIDHCLLTSKTLFASSAHKRYVISMAFRWRANDDPLIVVFGSLPSSTKTMDQVHFKQLIYLERLARMMKFSMLQVYLHARIQSGWPDPPPTTTPVGIWILWTITKLPSQHLLLPVREPCTRSAQSSHGGCSRRVHKIVYLAVNENNILVNFFTSENIHHELLSLINPAVYLLNYFFVD